MPFTDHFSGHSAEYKHFRPLYPTSMFEYLASMARHHERAWDCATGNGQAAGSIKPFFRQVIATDASPEQIAQVESVEGIEYAVAPAEQTQLADNSIDLVTVAQALHWFDLPRFYTEVKRVARQECVFAAWCYGLMIINQRLDAVINHFYHDILGIYWPAERRWIEERYTTVDFPFEELNPPAFQMTQHWTLHQLVGYLNTWSAVKKYQQQQGKNPLILIADLLREAWGDQPTMASEVRWPLCLRVGRVGGK